VKRLPLIAVLALLVGCGGSAPGSDGAELGRVEGTVFLGPQCPVETVESPCPDLPLADVEVQLTAGDEVVGTEVSDAAGRFTIEIEPGTYMLGAVLEAEPPASMLFAKPVSVTVVANGTVEANLLVDTGIR
jgi:hypothetical protein